MPAFCYQSLFRKRLSKVRGRVDELVALAVEQGPGVMHSVFAALTPLNLELDQALRELSWRRNESTRKVLSDMRAELQWLRDYAHLIVDLETAAPSGSAEVHRFLAWLADRAGQAPALSAWAKPTRERIIEMLDRS